MNRSGLSYEYNTFSAMIGIYKITSPSGKIYIGQSWNIGRRLKEHKCKERKSGATILQSSYKKYGVESHVCQVIAELPSDVNQEVLDRYEDFYIQQYKSCGLDLMNLKSGGRGGKHSEETKQKISKAGSGRIPSEETRAKLSKSKKGFKHSTEMGRKISEKKTGLKASEETRKKMSQAAKARVVAISADHREKINQSLRTPENRARIRKQMAEKPNNYVQLGNCWRKWWDSLSAEQKKRNPESIKKAVAKRALKMEDSNKKRSATLIATLALKKSLKNKGGDHGGIR